MKFEHYGGINLIYSPFFTVGILLLAITVFYLVFLTPQKNNSEHDRILDLLKVRYANNELSDSQYYEVKSILVDENSDNSAILVLKERYASGNLSSVEFIKMRDTII
jgi:uncharacterized membrane protein